MKSILAAMVVVAVSPAFAPAAHAQSPSLDDLFTRVSPTVVVVRSKGFVYEVLGDTPTPALIDAASDGRQHDAYQHPETGFWRLRDDKYDPPGTEYQQVYVAHVPECPGSRPYGISHLVEFGTQLHGPRQLCKQDAIEDGILPRFLPHPGSETNTDPHVWDDLREEVFEDVETFAQAEARAAELNAAEKAAAAL